MNHLENETSPYLLSHAGNPVEWYPWRDDVFEKAQKEDKPIFLSIGYSACHWCHVMEKESFEDPGIAMILNEHFVSIKVDREERPDIDKFYMNVCHVLTGSGGWPLSLFLTPQKEPFFAATYIPKENMVGRIGMIALLGRINGLWKNEREKIQESSSSIMQAISEMEKTLPQKKIAEDVFGSAFPVLKSSYDASFGGFGRAPKFPMTQNLDFLLRYHDETGDAEALKMVLHTLKNLRKGGIWDHVGKGFHRYSTDRAWVIPHFEKMIYDQSSLATCFLEAFQVSGDAFYRDSAVQIFDYVLANMTSRDGAFFTSEDADSEGEEGKYYIWSRHELMACLDKGEFSLLSEFFEIRQDKNILFLKKEPKDQKEDEGIENILKKLLAERQKRSRPFKDEKILLDLNSMMVSAFLKGYDVLGLPRYLEVAKRTIRFLQKNFKGDDGLLRHSYMAGKRGSIAFLDDHVFFIRALLDLYESDFDTEYLKEAIEAHQYLLTHYWDSENGGFYFTHQMAAERLFRKKEYHDGAIPSGNAVAMSNLVRIGKITQDNALLEKAYRLIESVSGSLKKAPTAHLSLLSAYHFLTAKAYEIVIVGQKGSEMERLVKQTYLPNRVVLFKKEEGNDDIENLAPYVTGMEMIQGHTAVYVCRDYQCSLPVHDREGLYRMLKKKA